MKKKTSIKIPPLKWVKITEIAKSKYRDVYYGQVKTWLKDSFSAYVVEVPDRKWIRLLDFESEKFQVEPVSEAEIVSQFNCVLLYLEREADSKAFDARDAERDVTVARQRYKEVFGGTKSGVAL